MDRTKHFEGIDKETLVCARCGYCRIDCPIYGVQGWESSAPRARMKISRDISLKGKGAPLQGFEKIFECTFCGKCRTACATDIDTLEVWRETRKEIARLKMLPDNIEKMNCLIQKHKNVTGDAPEARTMWLEALDPEDLRYIGKKSDLLYFPGCTGSLYPAAVKIPQSFVGILKEGEVDFSLLGAKEQCCGFPLLGCGTFHLGQDMVLKNIAHIAALGVKRVVTTCPSCYRTMQESWPQVLKGALPFQVVHASQFLEELIRERRITLKESQEEITYHDPCDLGRNGGVFEAPRNVIRSIPGVQLKEMKKNREDANCCGGGGNLEATNPGLGEKIALQRLAEAKTVEVKTIVSCCQQCKRTLANVARKNKIRMQVWDLTEFVYKNMEKKDMEKKDVKEVRADAD